MRALSKLDQWQEGTRLDSWLFRIAQNLWFDKLRANKVRGDRIDIDALENQMGEDGRDITESRLTLNAVASALGDLPPEQKVVIALVSIEGCSYKDASDILGIPIGTVMSRLARARVALHQKMHGQPQDV